MSSKRETPEQTINKLRQAEVELRNGGAMAQRRRSPAIRLRGRGCPQEELVCRLAG